MRLVVLLAAVWLALVFMKPAESTCCDHAHVAHADHTHADVASHEAREEAAEHDDPSSSSDECPPDCPEPCSCAASGPAASVGVWTAWQLCPAQLVDAAAEVTTPATRALRGAGTDVFRPPRA